MAKKGKREQAPRGDPGAAPPVDMEDPVEVASVDSFPASDPPGWITERPKQAPKKDEPRQTSRQPSGKK